MIIMLLGLLIIVIALTLNVYIKDGSLNFADWLNAIAQIGLATAAFSALQNWKDSLKPKLRYEAIDSARDLQRAVNAFYAYIKQLLDGAQCNAALELDQMYLDNSSGEFKWRDSFSQIKVYHILSCQLWRTNSEYLIKSFLISPNVTSELQDFERIFIKYLTLGANKTLAKESVLAELDVVFGKINDKLGKALQHHIMQ
jgi:hypothetical protein